MQKEKEPDSPKLQQEQLYWMFISKPFQCGWCLFSPILYHTNLIFQGIDLNNKLFAAVILKIDNINMEKYGCLPGFIVNNLGTWEHP